LGSNRIYSEKSVYIQVEPKSQRYILSILSSVAEPHYFYAAPAPGKNFDAAPADPAPAPTLLYSKAKFLKRTKF
jgi:hypothetical protein